MKSTIVLIDDEKLNHLTWKMCLKELPFQLVCFYSVDEFISSSAQYPEDVTICIDSDLGHGTKGEIESRRIHDLGFNDIYLTTGHDISYIVKPSWIKALFSKDVDELLKFLSSTNTDQ